MKNKYKDEIPSNCDWITACLLSGFTELILYSFTLHKLPGFKNISESETILY